MSPKHPVMAVYAKLSIEFFSLPQSGGESSVSPTNQSTLSCLLQKKNYLAVKLQVVLPCINRFMLINVLLKKPAFQESSQEDFPFHYHPYLQQNSDQFKTLPKMCLQLATAEDCKFKFGPQGCKTLLFAREHRYNA